ncbi:coiled-coil domain-containing protein 1 isoform X1 [Procambarus clarkii]|uniref:coiled-coil domain-containing protein 1 isoform X1 n=2 Tax=Procambarus clarkii TaxID=6728 RepID=UPI001E675C01|nr:trigger factor-like [Procambarus clarkii]
MMFTLRLSLAIVITCVCWDIATTNLKNSNVVEDVDYMDDLREYSAHHADDASAKYTARLNKIDMIDDYPHDDEYHDDRYDDGDDADEDDDDYDEYDDDDDEDDDDEDEEGGGCGGGDDADEEETTMNPVQEVIEEFFTR